MRSSDVQLVSVCRLFVLGLALAAALGAAPSAPGQTFRVIHTFSGSADGSTPNATMVMDQAGNLYGTTSYGGAQPGFAGSGIVFKLVRRNSAWILTPVLHVSGWQRWDLPRSERCDRPQWHFVRNNFTRR